MKTPWGDAPKFDIVFSAFIVDKTSAIYFSICLIKLCCSGGQTSGLGAAIRLMVPSRSLRTVTVPILGLNVTTATHV